MILLIGSFVFYAWGQHFYMLLLMLSIVVNYTFGRLIGERQSQKKPLLVLGLIYNFGLLVFFKYTNFFIENINALLTATHVQIPDSAQNSAGGAKSVLVRFKVRLAQR